MTNRSVIYLLWTVIASLIIGGVIAGYIVVHRADELNQSNTDLTNTNATLHRQLDEAQAKLASPSPSPSASPTASPSASPSTTPTPTATPK
jgi:hypothetical protein